MRHFFSPADLLVALLVLSRKIFLGNSLVPVIVRRTLFSRSLDIVC